MKLDSKRLNLGCGKNILQGWINLDIVANNGVDVIADLDQCKKTKLPFKNKGGKYFLSITPSCQWLSFSCSITNGCFFTSNLPKRGMGVWQMWMNLLLNTTTMAFNVSNNNDIISGAINHLYFGWNLQFCCALICPIFLLPYSGTWKHKGIFLHMKLDLFNQK